MMLRTGVAALSIFALTTAAVAQEAGPITNREVVGEWTLTVTPADQSVSFESADGTSPDFPLKITRRRAGPPTCVVRDRPAECRIDEEGLIIESASRTGEARLIFTLTARTATGFSGMARIRVGSLPDGMHVGAVTMVRR